jgi:predicted nucleic acid-binding protein
VIILDTDALGHIQKRDPVGVRIEAGLDDCPDRDVRITAVTAYEMLGGAVALIDRRKRELRDLIPAFYLVRGTPDVVIDGFERSGKDRRCSPGPVPALRR